MSRSGVAKPDEMCLHRRTLYKSQLSFGHYAVPVSMVPCSSLIAGLPAHRVTLDNHLLGSHRTH